jgi:hypothetical protein
VHMQCRANGLHSHSHRRHGPHSHRRHGPTATDDTDSTATDDTDSTATENTDLQSPTTRTAQATENTDLTATDDTDSTGHREHGRHGQQPTENTHRPQPPAFGTVCLLVPQCSTFCPSRRWATLWRP